MSSRASFVQGKIFLPPSPDSGLQLEHTTMTLTETDGGNKRSETTEMHLQKQIIQCPADIGASDSRQSLVKKREVEN